MTNLRPTFYLPSVAELNPSLLKEQIPELSGVTFDLDKTLVGQHEESIPLVNLEALIAINALGLRLGIISNATSRIRTHRAQVLAEGMSNLIGEEVPVVTSRMVDGKKKPLMPVFDKMSEVLGLPPARLCYVGDQLFKDVLGANRAGYGGSILVAPYGHGDDPRVKYLQRPIEAGIRPLLGIPFLAKNFGRRVLTA